ncbi:hypothetical protein SK128_003747, partial [Halocaridina rubra]
FVVETSRVSYSLEVQRLRDQCRTENPTMHLADVSQLAYRLLNNIANLDHHSLYTLSFRIAPIHSGQF